MSEPSVPALELRVATGACLRGAPPYCDKSELSPSNIMFFKAEERNGSTSGEVSLTEVSVRECECVRK